MPRSRPGRPPIYWGGKRTSEAGSSSTGRGPDAHREFLERTKLDTLDVARALDVDMVRVSYWRMEQKPTCRIDERTFQYGDPDGSYQVMRFDPESELYQVVDRHPKIEPTEADLEAEVERMERGLESYHPSTSDFPDIHMGLEAFGGERAVPGTGVGIGVYNRATHWFEAIAYRPDLVNRYLAVQAERAIRCVEALADVEVRVMLGGGDMATNYGPMYSPKSFRELLVPNLKRIVDACHRHGKLYFFASDGNLWPIADDLFPVVDGFYEIDRKAGMDLKLLRERYPHLTLIGNISSYTLHVGTRETVVEETLSCIEDARRYGGIIVGVSNLIVSQTPEVNLMAMVETLRENR
jgi:hypothetical protein